MEPRRAKSLSDSRCRPRGPLKRGWRRRYCARMRAPQHCRWLKSLRLGADFPDAPSPESSSRAGPRVRPTCTAVDRPPNHVEATALRCATERMRVAFRGAVALGSHEMNARRGRDDYPRRTCDVLPMLGGKCRRHLGPRSGGCASSRRPAARFGAIVPRAGHVVAFPQVETYSCISLRVRNYGCDRIEDSGRRSAPAGSEPQRPCSRAEPVRAPGAREESTPKGLTSVGNN